jgi:hypothetical protein
MGVGANNTFWMSNVNRAFTGSNYYNISLNPLGGNVGIGTTSPGYKLTVNGDVDVNNGAILAAQAYGINLGASGYDILMPTTTRIAIRAGASERISILNTGKVGIGTTNPLANLDISNDAGSVYQQWSYDNPGANNYNLTLSETVTSGNVRFCFNQRNAGTNYDNVLVFNQGNVGIGTDNPNNILHVSDAGTSTLVRVGNNAAYDAGIYFNTSTDWTIGTDTSNSNAFTIGNSSSVGASPKVTIATSGNVGIGTTSNSAEDTNNGVPKLQVTTATAVLGEFPLAARFTTASDAGDDSGVSVLINSGNDRGLMISAGRQTGNVSKVTLNVVKNDGDEIDTITLLQNGSSGSTANVGIGTTNPAQKLQVTSSAGNAYIRYNNGSYTGIDIGQHSGGNIYYWNRDATDQIWGNNSVERMRITSAGNVGIGTTSPSQKLHVSGNARVTGAYYDSTGVAGSPGTAGQVLSSTVTGTDWVTPSSGGGIGGSIASTQIAFGSGTSNEITGESALVYSNLNGLTIGTGSVSGSNSILSLNKGASGTGMIRMQSAGTNMLDIRVDNNEDAYITSGNALTLLSGSSDHIILNPGGNVGIGTTSPTSYKLDVTGTGRFTSTVTATNFILSSDKRLKDNIKNIDNNHIDVDWKNFELKSEPGIKRSGVIAQELEDKHPEFVRTDKEGLKSVAYIDLLIAKIAELEARLEKAGI